MVIVLDCTIPFSLWWTMVKMAIYTQKYEQKWLNINKRGVEIKMSWVEKNRKINKWGVCVCVRGGGVLGEGDDYSGLESKSFKHINGRHRCQKSNLLLFQWHDQYQKLRFKLTKNRQKVAQKHWYLLHRIHHD